MREGRMIGLASAVVLEVGWLAAVGLAVVLALFGVVGWRVASLPHSLRVSILVELNYWLCRAWYSLRVEDSCTVPASGAVLIVASHTCTADPLLICAGCRYRKIGFMIAREYANFRFWRFFVRSVGCIPVRRDGQDVAATKRAIRHLQAGHALGLFIEGRIAPPREQAGLKHGAALLALRSGAPVIPCHISGTVYRDGILPGFLARHRARVRFGPPVDLSDLAGNRGREALEVATRRIAERIRALAPESPGA
jgi:1-acyl-sn-glycerol-3-phosphate acyltransferase